MNVKFSVVTLKGHKKGRVVFVLEFNVCEL